MLLDATRILSKPAQGNNKLLVTRKVKLDNLNNGKLLFS